MKNLTSKEIVRATLLKTDIDKFNFAFEISEEFEEFFVILEYSFDYTEEMLNQLKSGLEGKFCKMDFDFMKTISKIKEEHSLFQASVFCASHFKMIEFDSSMLNIFGFKAEEIVRVKKILDGVQKMLLNNRHNIQRKEIEFDKSKCETNVYQPANFFPVNYNDTINGIVVSDCNGNFKRNIVLESDAEKIKDCGVRILKEWNTKSKGLYIAEMKRLRKIHDVEVHKDGAKRKVIILN